MNVLLLLGHGTVAGAERGWKASEERGRSEGSNKCQREREPGDGPCASPGPHRDHLAIHSTTLSTWRLDHSPTSFIQPRFTHTHRLRLLSLPLALSLALESLIHFLLFHIFSSLHIHMHSSRNVSHWVSCAPENKQREFSSSSLPSLAISNNSRGTKREEDTHTHTH